MIWWLGYKIIEGFNGIILGFGQTGTGKSFTLGGLQFSEDEFGVAPRVILDLFKFKNELPRNIKMRIHMSYTEFSKSNVIDLLKDFPNFIDPWHVKDASKIKIKNEYEAMKLLYKGEGRKTFVSNNEYRSHVGSSVLTFHIATANQDFTCPEKISSRNIKSLSKRIKRSKDSMITLEKTKPVESRGSIRTKRSVLINRSPSGLVASGISVSQYVKRVRSNSTSLGKQSSVMNRKSTANLSVKDRRESKKDLAEASLVPDNIPRFETAWNAFINDGKSTYKALFAPYKVNENDIRKVYMNYQKEMNGLQICKEVVGRRENELLEAKMFQKFNASNESDPVITDIDKICQENLNHARIDLLEQQEVVLKSQSELKILLNNRRHLKQLLQDDFDQYCRENYNVTIPILVAEGEEEEVILEEVVNVDTKKSDEDVEQEQLKCLEKTFEMIKLDKLKKIMEREICKNKKLRELKNRKWKNPY